MQLCPRCHTENEDGLNFCRECGAALQPLPPMPQIHAGVPGFALKNLPGWVWGALALVLSLAAGAYLLLYGPGGIYSIPYGERAYGNWILAVTDEDSTLYSINVLTGEKYQIERDVYRGFILPDEKRLVYVTVGRNDTRDIFLCDIRGENKKTIVTGLSDIVGSEFSPDGSVLAITWGDDTSGYNVDVYSTRSGRKLGSPVSNLRGVEDFDIFSISANGRYILYDTDNHQKNCETNYGCTTHAIYLVDVKGEETTTISETSVFLSGAFAFFTKDGSRVIYIGEDNIWSLDVSSRKRERIYTGAEHLVSVGWIDRDLFFVSDGEKMVAINRNNGKVMDEYDAASNSFVYVTQSEQEDMQTLWWYNLEEGSASVILEAEEIGLDVHGDEVAFSYTTTIEVPGFWDSTTHQITGAAILDLKTGKIEKILAHDGLYAQMYEKLPLPEEIKEMLMDNPENVGRVVDFDGKHVLLMQELPESESKNAGSSLLVYTRGWKSYLYPIAEMEFGDALLLAKGERIVFVSGNDIYVSDTKGEDINLLLKDATIVFYQ